MTEQPTNPPTPLRDSLVWSELVAGLDCAQPYSEPGGSEGGDAPTERRSLRARAIGWFRR